MVHPNQSINCGLINLVCLLLKCFSNRFLLLFMNGYAKTAADQVATQIVVF